MPLTKDAVVLATATLGTTLAPWGLAFIQSYAVDKKLDAKDVVNAEALLKAGVIRRLKDGVRILGSGELKAKVAFEVAGASKPAIEKIEKAGGSVKLLVAAAEAAE